MRVIAIFMSVLTLSYLLYSFIIDQQASQVAQHSLGSPKWVVPANISSIPLKVETVWQQLKADRIKAKQPIEKVKQDSLQKKDILTIGENKYALYGIFNGRNETGNNKQNEPLNQAFILIKALENKDKSTDISMLKVLEGDELSEGISLISVTTNSISFKQDDQLIEFKLFEAKQ